MKSVGGEKSCFARWFRVVFVFGKTVLKCYRLPIMSKELKKRVANVTEDQVREVRYLPTS